MDKYTKSNARFTVITDGVIRMEYAENKAFLDEPTLFAKRENTSDADISDVNGTLTVKTEKFTLTYKGTGPFSRDDLSCRIHTDGVDTVWHYGDEPKNNLKGTLTTLDGVCGERPLPDGIISKDGFYVFDDSSKPKLRNGWIENRSEDHKIDLYLFAYGLDFKAAIRDLAKVSGEFPLPRRCIFGSWYSRWWKYTSAEFIDLVDQYDKNDFPLDIMVMDMDWHYQDWGHNEGEPYALYGYGHAGQNLGWTGYTWNKTVIPDPKGLIEELKERKIRTVLNDHPADGLRDHDEGYDSFIAELDSNGYTEEVLDIPEKISDREKNNADRNIKNFRFNAGSPVYMNAFFNHALAPKEDLGIEFWWLDWQQDYIYPTVNKIKDLPHLPWLNHLYYEHSRNNGTRGASCSRWGGIGDHKHPAYFSGDAVSGWETLAFEIKMTATASNAGCFWWSHDIGGFVDPIPGGQSENYVRWVQFGAMSASLRLHMNGVEGFDRRPWTWGEPYCSAMRKAFHLRSRLFPYIYSSAAESAFNALPFLRPLYYEAPDKNEAYENPTTYFLGSHLIVSPVCSPAKENGKAETKLWLPDGLWVDMFTEKCYTGGSYTIESTLETFPLFCRANTPIVTRPYTSRMTTDPLTDIYVDVYCQNDESGSFVLYEDDGETELYREGQRRETAISYEKSGGAYKLAFTPSGTFEGAPKKRNVTVRLHNVKGPVSCAEADKVSYDPTSNTLCIELMSRSADEPFVIVAK